VSRLLASWFGTGLILRRLRGADSGSGTIASVVTYPLAVLLGEIGVWTQAVALVAVVAVALIVIPSHASEEGDAGWIVIDEAAGTMVATLGLGWIAGLVALAVFRIADIFKVVPGVGRAERITGAAGIVADDLVAGLYGLAAGLLTASVFAL
jgi:phosphatidylglycerophosphatase A